VPRRKSSVADDLVLLPWWVSVVLAGAAFLFLPTILPAALHNVVFIIVFVLLGLAGISALRSFATRGMFERQTSIQSLRELPWKQFEDLLGEAYRRQGFRVEESLGAGADGGVDLVLGNGGDVTLVQCKRWKGKPVPVQIVRELYGVLHDRGVSAAKVVATTRFTSEAVAFAKGKPIELVDQDSLLELIRGVQKSGRMTVAPTLESSDASPVCPSCGSEMVRRTAKRGANAGGSFWGCQSYPKCRGTRAIVANV
jgi:restriction system protein